MRNLILAVLLLLCGQLSFSQEQEKPTELSADAKVNAGLKLDLLASQKATLEARSDKLRLEGELLQLQVAIWNDSRDQIKRDLDAVFGCNYDLDRRECQKKPPEKPVPE